jgi:hypothetical protein
LITLFLAGMVLPALKMRWNGKTNADTSPALTTRVIIACNLN